MKTNTLSPFTLAYIECALWSSMDNANDQGGEPLDENYCIDDLSPECLAKMQADCEEFQKANADLLDTSSLDAPQQGHDFWLTRNGHGAGFWDRYSEVSNPDEYAACKTLSDKCGWGTPFPEVDLYVGDDGQIHCS